MKKLLVFALAIIAMMGSVRADEGMWLPMFVERLNYVDMQKMGLQLTPEELYSINHSSLKDAIVGLGSESNPAVSSAPVKSSQSMACSSPTITAATAPCKSSAPWNTTTCTTVSGPRTTARNSPLLR